MHNELLSCHMLMLLLQEGWPKETGDMHLWGHHDSAQTVDDHVLRSATAGLPDDGGSVSFVFRSGGVCVSPR